MHSSQQIVEFGGFQLDVGERLLTDTDGNPVALTPKLFDTLLFLVERPGRLIEKRALMESVWARVVVEENTLSRTISTLRQLLGETAGDKRYIATVPGVGYRFVPAVVNATPGRVTGGVGERSIAVLPFEDLSPEQDHKYFSNGMAEELIMQLGNIRGLRIIAKTSSFQLEGATARHVGRRLGASHSLTGAVRRSGSRLRINVQLIDTSTEQQVWSGQYDRLIDDVLDIQEDIAQAVAQALRANLGLGFRISHGCSRNLEAYDLYLRAKSVAAQTGAQPFAQSIELCRRAVALDPGFALAWTNIALMTRNLLFFSAIDAASLRSDIADATAQAMQIDRHSWPTHVAQSALQAMNRNWIEVERSLALATELAPSPPSELNINWAHHHALVGNAVAASEYMREAVQQDPLSLLASAAYQLMLHFTGQEDVAEAEYQRSIDLSGNRDMVEHVAIHRAWVRGGPFAKQMRRYLEHQTLSVPVLASLMERHEQPDYMVRELLLASSQPMYQDPVRQVMLGWWLAHYGAVDEAMTVVARAYVDRAYANTSWLWFPVFAALRRRAEFSVILDHVGLPAYWRWRQNWGDFCAPGVDGTVNVLR